MKISNIRIENFRQFRNLNIDLCYPAGHEKAGQPLDKVCIIGQNGTGKTTILDIISMFFTSGVYLDKYMSSRTDDSLICITNNGENFVFEKNNIKNHNLLDSLQRLPSWKEKTQINKLIHIPHVFFDPNNKEARTSDTKAQMDYAEKDYILFNDGIMSAVEFKTFKNIEAFREKEIDFSLQLKNRIENGEDIDFSKEVKNWAQDNPNPLKAIANYLDKILEKFNLKTQIQTRPEQKRVIIPLVSTTQKDLVIPFTELSSGIHRLFFTANPLYQLLEEHTIVLMDEPETSLYPDLQRDVISYYTNLRNDLIGKVQYFFATHSPIIASAFDPWEIVDLEFDKDGFVRRHLYYNGENHVDNYNIHPKYLRWDSILDRVFDVEVSGDMARENALQELSELKSKIAYWKKEGMLKNADSEMNQKIDRYKQLLQWMDWKEKETNV